MKSFHLRLLPLLTFFLAFVGFSSSVFAKSPESFGNQYNLFVTNENRDKSVPTYQATQILESYFLGAPLKTVPENPEKMISQQELLVAFEMLRAQSKGQTVDESDAKLYYKTWLNARRHNLLPRPEITFGNLQEFLYRYEVSQKHFGIPYFEGLVLDNADINPDHFSKLAEVKLIQNKLLTQLNQLRSLGEYSEDSSALESLLDSHYQAFMAVEQELIRREHPVNKIPNMPEDIKQKILDNNLNQILNQLTYSYSRDAAYRRFNLIKGLMTMNGRVYQPGEQISFTKALEEGPGGLSGYRMGYVIKGDEEELEYGGGLCGSATLFFTPSWRAGMEVVSRRGHSAYFSNLYPKESLGLDATIYFGSLDVIMKNNTGSPVLYYVHDDAEKKEVTMYVIGNSPYADVRIEGPIKTGGLSYRYIRHLTMPDGTVVSQPINTRYNRMY